MSSRTNCVTESARQSPVVAIVIPCYRVARHIGALIRRIPPRFTHIICVDDASPDDTANVITALADPRVLLIRHEHNRGVGGAMKTGYRHALSLGAAFIVKMDGDGQMSPDDLDSLLAPLRAGEADYAKGNRFVDLHALRRMPTARLAGNALLSLASKVASGYWNMLDVSNGYTAITGTLLQRLELPRLADRYFFETSMLIELYLVRARVSDVTMPARYGDETSSLHLGRVLLTFPPLLIRGLARRFFWRYLIEDFGLASLCVITGLPLLLFGTGFGVMRWLQSIETGVPASSGTVILAALPIILGFQLLLTAALLDVMSARVVKVGTRPVTHRRSEYEGGAECSVSSTRDVHAEEPLGVG